MPYFTYHRDHTLATTRGHVLDFKKGEKIWVPPECVRFVLEIGAVPEDAMVDDEKKAPEDPQGDERKDSIRSAFELLVARNSREDFNATGVPTIAAVTDLAGFKVDKHELKALWAEFQAK